MKGFTRVAEEMPTEIEELRKEDTLRRRKSDPKRLGQRFERGEEYREGQENADYNIHNTQYQ